MLLKKLFYGEMGLVKTYWLWGVLGGGIVTLGSYLAIIIATKNIDNIFLYDAIIDGYSIFAGLWIVFISIAIINSASYNRERGAWGWIASIIAVLGIIRGLSLLLYVVGIGTLSWNDMQRSLVAENMGLPIQLDEDLTLIKMSLNSAERSLIYSLNFNLDTLTEDTFDAKLGKELLIESCADFKEYFDGPIKKITFSYTAIDNTNVNLDLFPNDCEY